MPLTLVIFGASGDLTSRKLVPALYELSRKQRLPAGTQIVGFSRSPFTDEQWRQSLARSTQEFSNGRFDQEAWNKFAPTIHYQHGDLGQAADFEALHARLRELEGSVPITRVYYLATASQFYEQTVTRLGESGKSD